MALRPHLGQEVDHGDLLHTQLDELLEPPQGLLLGDVAAQGQAPEDRGNLGRQVLRGEQGVVAQFRCGPASPPRAQQHLDDDGGIDHQRHRPARCSASTSSAGGRSRTPRAAILASSSARLGRSAIRCSSPSR